MCVGGGGVNAEAFFSLCHSPLGICLVTIFFLEIIYFCVQFNFKFYIFCQNIGFSKKGLYFY